MSYCCFKLTVCPRIKPKWRPIQLINSGFFKWFVIQGIIQFNRNIFRVLQDFMLEMKNELLRKQPNTVPGRSYIKRIFGLSTGTVITKEAKEPNNRVPLGALSFGWIVSFVVRNLRLSTYRRKKNVKVARTDFLAWGVHCVRLSQSTLYAQDLTGNNMAACRYFSAFFLPFSVRLLISMLNWSLSLMWRIPQIILNLWGFSCIRDAGRRGNRITVSAAS